MNRRELLGKGLSGAALTVMFPGWPTARGEYTRSRDCTESAFTETVARAIMAETGTWKHALGIRGPMLVTRNGCCACEIVSIGTNEWSFKMRPMSSAERESFQREYGQVASLLTCCQLGDHEIRAFIHNGRKLGWNLSVQRRSDA